MEGEFLIFLISLGWLIFTFSCFMFVVGYFSKSVSHRYRKYLTNLYVAGKIRQYSEKSNVDLKKEEIEFFKYLKGMKKDRMDKEIKDFDDRVEQKLNQEIDSDIDKAESKK